MSKMSFHAKFQVILSTKLQVLMEWTSLTLLPFLKKSKIYIQNLDDILGCANLRFFRKG